jgi:vacuolar-type H+-ATPase subunit F/Vma7
MTIAIFLGDEVTAAGYRLAGLRVRVPQPGEELSVLEWACSQTDFVLMTAEYAMRIPPQVLHRVLVAPHPLMLVVPDARGQVAVPDLAARIRRQLSLSP